MRVLLSVEFPSPLLSSLWSRFRNSFHQRLNDHGQSWTTEDTSDQCNLVITLVFFENYCDERMLAKIFITDLIKSSIKMKQLNHGSLLNRIYKSTRSLIAYYTLLDYISNMFSMLLFVLSSTRFCICGHSLLPKQPGIFSTFLLGVSVMWWGCDGYKRGLVIAN